jgi:hypothetical protein
MGLREPDCATDGYVEVDCSAHGFSYVPGNGDTDCEMCRLEQLQRNEMERQRSSAVPTKGVHNAAIR